MDGPPGAPATAEANRASNRRRAVEKRRAITLFVSGAIVAALGATSGLWLPALPTVLGFMEANNALIGALADVSQIVTFLTLLAGGVLGWLGYRRWPGSDREPGEQVRQTVDVGPGGRGAAVGGYVNQGAVVVGDHNWVSVAEGVTYAYSDTAPSSTGAEEIAEAGRRLEELPLEEVPDRGPLPAQSVMPLRPNRHFVGRGEEIKRLAASLKSGDTTTIGEAKVAASSGLGGVGKTQLAVEFVHRYARYFAGVYWLSFAEPRSVGAEVAACGGAGGMELRPDFHLLPLEERVQAVTAAWQDGLPRLLVFDNCEDDELLERWLPPSGSCRVLLTSRRGSWDPSLGVIELALDVLERRESVALLREHRGDLPPDSPGLDAIAEELGDLPLALDLAGRYLARYRREVTPEVYLRELRRPELLEHPSLKDARGVSPTKHDMDVWRTFAVSYEQLNPNDEADAAAVKLLARASRLAAGQPTPEWLLVWTLEPGGGEFGPPEPTPVVRDALGRLTDLGLLRAVGEDKFEMHRLVRAFALEEVADPEARPAAQTACVRAAKWASRAGLPGIFEELLVHLRTVTDAALERAYDDEAADCCSALNAALLALHAYDEALPYARLACRITEDLLDAEDPATLQRRTDMALVLKGQGDQEGARAIYEEVLEAQERVLGREHPDVAATLNNLAITFRGRGLYHEVLPRYRRALSIRQHAWEKTEPGDEDRREAAYRVSESYSNMGALMLDLGRHREAQQCIKEAFGITLDEFGENHERLAGHLTLYAAALRADKDHPGAAASLVTALEIYDRVYAGAPPKVAYSVAALGAVFKEWADEDETLEPDERPHLREGSRHFLALALDGADHFLGEGGFLSGGLLGALAEVCEAMGSAEEGSRYRTRAEAARDENLRGGDADAAREIDAQGTALTEAGLYDEASIYLQHALSIRENALGPRSFDTSTSLFKLGVLHQLWDRNAQARRYLERTLAVRTSVCGEDHPATELVRENLRLLDN